MEEPGASQRGGSSHHGWTSNPIESNLFQIVEELQTRQQVQAVLQEMVMDVEWAATLQERFKARHAVQALQQTVEEQASALEESRIVHVQQQQQQAVWADALVQQLWQLSRKLNSLEEIKAAHKTLSMQYDELMAKWMQAVEDLELANTATANNSTNTSATAPAPPAATSAAATAAGTTESPPAEARSETNPTVTGASETNPTQGEDPLESDPKLVASTKPPLVVESAQTRYEDHHLDTPGSALSSDPATAVAAQPGRKTEDTTVLVDNKHSVDEDCSKSKNEPSDSQQPTLTSTTTTAAVTLVEDEPEDPPPRLETLDTALLMHIFGFLDALDILNTAEINASMYSRVDALFGLGGTVVTDQEDNSTIATNESMAAPSVLTPSMVTPPSTATATASNAGLHQQSTQSQQTTTKAAAAVDPTTASASPTMVTLPPPSTAGSTTTTPTAPPVLGPPTTATAVPTVAAVAPVTTVPAPPPTTTTASPQRKTAGQTLNDRLMETGSGLILGLLQPRNKPATATVGQQPQHQPTTAAQAAASPKRHLYHATDSLVGSSSTGSTAATSGSAVGSSSLGSTTGASLAQAARSVVATATAAAASSSTTTASTTTVGPGSAGPQPMNATMANAMAAKLTDAELNAIILMTDRLKQKEVLADQLSRQVQTLTAQLEGTVAVKDFLISKVRDMEHAMSRQEENEGKVALQIASDQEVIAFLDGRVQELEHMNDTLEQQLAQHQAAHDATKQQADQRSSMMAEMLQFEREKWTEHEQEWKATKKVLVREVKNCRAQLVALQAECDGIREQNERLRAALLTSPSAASAIAIATPHHHYHQSHGGMIGRGGGRGGGVLATSTTNAPLSSVDVTPNRRNRSMSAYS